MCTCIDILYCNFFILHLKIFYVLKGAPFRGAAFSLLLWEAPPPPLVPAPLEPLRPAAVPTWIIAALLSRGPWSVCLSLALSTFYPGALVAQFRVSSHFYLEQKNKKEENSPPPRRETAGKKVSRDDSESCDWRIFLHIPTVSTC